jgi:cob(I)alamin adenosyltransferase
MTQNKLTQGYIQVYTGKGKGKTTAALGLTFRALGHGLKIYIGQFMKGQPYGELTSAKQFKNQLTIEQFGQPTFVHVEKATQKDIQLANDGLQRTEQLMLSENYDIIIMDEINVAIYFKLVSVSDVLQVLGKKPSHVEIICTGRNAPDELLERADLVTEMKEIKHYFNNGIAARKGFEM